jgi:hypothetical protein
MKNIYIFFILSLSKDLFLSVTFIGQKERNILKIIGPREGAKYLITD